MATSISDIASTDNCEPIVPAEYPPGIAKFKKCESSDDANLIALKSVAVSLLLATKESGVCSLPPKSRSISKEWKKLSDDLFHGRLTNGRRDGNGVFRGYMEWSCRDPQTLKLKPLVLNIIKFFAAKYEEREDEDEATVLEQLAGELQRDIKAAEKKRMEEQDADFAQRIQNEQAEEDMGFVSPGVGVRPPSGVVVGDAERQGLSLLAQTTSSRQSNRGKKSAFANISFQLMQIFRLAPSNISICFFHLEPWHLQPQLLQILLALQIHEVELIKIALWVIWLRLVLKRPPTPSRQLAHLTSPS